MVSKIVILIYNLSKKKIPSNKFFSDLIKRALVILKERNKICLSLIFIDSQTSRKLNKYWRHKNSIASVLSFSLKENLPIEFFKKEKILGDIFLCPEKIKNQAQEFKIPIVFLYKKLIIHSLLHLYGYNHSRKKEARKMEELENKILDSLK